MRTKTAPKYKNIYIYISECSDRFWKSIPILCLSVAPLYFLWSSFVHLIFHSPTLPLNGCCGPVPIHSLHPRSWYVPKAKAKPSKAHGLMFLVYQRNPTWYLMVHHCSVAKTCKDWSYKEKVGWRCCWNSSKGHQFSGSSPGKVSGEEQFRKSLEATMMCQLVWTPCLRHHFPPSHSSMRLKYPFKAHQCHTFHASHCGKFAESTSKMDQNGPKFQNQSGTLSGDQDGPKQPPFPSEDLENMF